MKITILNGEMSDSNGQFSEYINSLVRKFGDDHKVDLFKLDDMNLSFCMGCWTCWWKTPGICAIKDDAKDIMRSVINSDFFILASPLNAGFTSSILKKVTERLVILLHPYVELRNGESHHKKRYENYPDFGLIVQKEDDTDDEDLEIISDIYDRIAINFHCNKRYLKITDNDKIEDIIYETCNI